MKKILLILCALVCGTLAFAQTGSYTDNLHVIVNGDDEGVKKGNVTIVYQEGDENIIDFTLHDFSVEVYIGAWMTINLGDITVYDIELGDEEDGVAPFSCTDDHHVEYPDIDSDYASWVTDVAITMTGDLSETKLRAKMDITVKILGILSYPITATFGYDYEYLIVNAETGNYLGGGLNWGTMVTEVGKPQFFTFTDQFDGTYTIFGHQGGTSIGWASPDDGYFYVDAATPLTWELIEADEGSGYYLAYNSGYMLSGGFQQPMGHVNSYTSATVWKFVTMDDVVANMDDASADNPVDVTPLIPAPEPKRANWGSSWVTSGYGTSNAADNVSLGQDGNPASCAESYHSANGFDVRQTFSLPKTGYYVVSAHAFYRNDGSSTVLPSMYITTGTCATDEEGDITKVDLPLHTTSAANMVDAYNEFLDGLYPVSLLFKVDAEDEEFTVGFESNTTTDDEMWTIFGELGLSYTGSEAPALEAVSGTMNKDVQAAMTTALSAYNANPTSATYAVAAQAIAAAENSIAQYEQMAAEIAEVVPELDDAGTAVWEESDACAGYEAQTLESADEVIAALSAAQKAQTTANSDLTYALLNSGAWAADQGNGPNSYSTFATETYIDSGEATSGKVLYYTVSDLQPGTYTVTFYAAVNMANGLSGDSGEDLADAYANGATSKLVIGTNSAAQITSLDDMTLVTLTCTVDYNGVLEFGLEDTSDGGNWFLCAAGTLTLLELSGEEDPYIYDITSLLENPSFEDVDVTELTVDGTRCDTTVGGAWTVTSLEGWDLAAPTHSTASYAACDIMSADATSTDNNFGVPGEPSDETYMLYLRESHESYSGAGTSASVMQSVVLPAGEYKLTVDSKCVASMEAAETVTLVAGDESKALNIHITANGTDDTKTNPFLSAWDTGVLTFSLTETTEVSLGVAIAYDTTKDLALSVLLDNFQLWSTEAVETVSYDYDVTWALANPSFETDKVANLTVDETRGNENKDGGAWTVSSLTGWTLTPPNNTDSSRPVSDLMTSSASETDNDYGVPGEPSDGTYMLYLRNSWTSGTETASVLQSVTLPEGDYKLTVDTKCVSSGSYTSALLVAGDHSVNLTVHGKQSTTKEDPYLDAWDTPSITFTSDGETEITLGVTIAYANASAGLSVLLDNFKLYSVEEIEKTISWTMTEAGWGTMILPFAASIPDGLTMYAGDAITVSDSELELGTEASSIAANTPYLVSGDAGSYSFSGTPVNEAELYTSGVLTGSLVDLSMDKGAVLTTDGTNYVLQDHGEEDDGLAFYPITSESTGVTLDAYHCYLTSTSGASGVRGFISLPGDAGEETGIEAVESDLIANDAIYDLSGRRVAKAVKGVYIMNGKKVLVK